MNTANIWLQQETLRRAAKKIARNFFPKPVQRDIYSICLDSGQTILSNYDKQEHGALWPWVFLNMLAIVDGPMCASMIEIVCQSKIPWQQNLARECHQIQRLIQRQIQRSETAVRRALRGYPTATSPKTLVTSSAHLSL